MWITHAQADAFTFEIDLEYAHFDGLSDPHAIPWVAHKLIGQFRNMDQSILAHPNVHKSAEVGDVADHALELHALVQISDGCHSLFKLGCFTLSTRVTAGPCYCFAHIFDRGHTKT